MDYRIKIQADKYPCEYIVRASNWATAVARGVREWRNKKGKGSHADKLSIIVIKSKNL